MSIPRVPIYNFDFLRHHVSMIYAHFLWRTHLLTQISLKTGVHLYKQLEELYSLGRQVE